MQKIIFTLISLLLFLSACQESTKTKTAEAKAITKPAAIKMLPDLPPIYERFEDLAPILAQQNDTIYVINFWATWCAPCVKELPYFEAVTEKYADQKVKVILVSLDFSKQLETKLKPFLKENNLQSEVLVLIDPDANSWVDKVNPAWSGAIPATIVYQGAKNKFYEKSFESLAELEEVVTPFL
ncbi:MAG: TlpA disulfide reductase family protein [Saprospiraceae bacterium]